MKRGRTPQQNRSRIPATAKVTPCDALFPPCTWIQADPLKFHTLKLAGAYVLGVQRRLRNERPNYQCEFFKKGSLIVVELV